MANKDFNYKLKIYPINVKQGDLSLDAKTSRITALIPLFENGEIYLHESYDMLLYEYNNYPSSMTIDGLDSLGWLRQLHWSVKPKGAADEFNRRQYAEYRQQVSNSRTGYG